MKRIYSIEKYIDNNDRVIDVGCDHAFLSMILSKRNIYSIASDIKENIIMKAFENVSKKKLSNNIDFRVGNGLEVLKSSDDINTVVLSGMGSNLIIQIMKNANKVFEKIITVSNREHEYLREEMLKLGYVVDLEEIIYEKNKYYNLILFKPGKTEYSEDELLLGRNHQNLDLFYKKNRYELDKINNIFKNKKINNKKLIRKKEILEKYI